MASVLIGNYRNIREKSIIFLGFVVWCGDIRKTIKNCPDTLEKY